MIRRLLFILLPATFLIVVAARSEGPKQIDAKPKKVKLETTMGDIVIELDEKAAPVTVRNFLTYVEEGFYDGTVFHRVIPNFMIQGGGFTADMAPKKTHPPIVNEAENGLKNDRGTIAMARTNNPDSATSQFFINQKNNDFLNYAGPDKPGYAVFGKVVEGVEVVDKIAAVETTTRGEMRDVPIKPIAIKSAKVISEKKD
jgi:cyclophilin family peptidyl-prolyl cis-trans isomerase